MGRLTEKFKQLIGAKKTLPAEGPGAAENPKGFMEYNLNSRKISRYETKAYNMINSLPLSLAKTQEVLHTVLGEEKANEFIETCFSSSPFKTPVYSYIRNHKEILDGISEERKNKILKNDEEAVRFAREEYAKGEASKFPRQEYEKILSGALRRGIKGLDPETELKVVEGFENALSQEQID